MYEPLVRVYRGGRVESIHYGAICVVDASGRLIAYAGSPDTVTCLRSSAKPFQAVPLLDEGAVEEFDLSSEEIATICASHGGEPRHVSTAAAILRKGDFDESDLLCASHMPFDEKSAADLRLSGEPPTPLHNNCSGKHAGMLLATKLLDSPSATYLEPSNPVQVRIRESLAGYAEADADEIEFGVDGCGVPAFFLSMYRSALAYARFTAAAHAPDETTLPSPDSAATIFGAMTSHPGHVAGSWSITTPLMQNFPGQLLAKEGGEGFYAMGIAPQLAARTAMLATTEAVGISIKISDGSMGRGRNPAILRTLELVGCPAESPQLDRYRAPLIRNWAGAEVGRVAAEFDLRFL